MIAHLILAAASFLTSPVEELVLRNGTVLPVEELVRVERGRLIFVDSEGVLYSLRLSDLDVEATDARLPANRTAADESARKPAGTTPGHEGFPSRLPVSEEEKRRILEEMERRSHTGKPAPHPDPASEDAEIEMVVEGESDEAAWRAEAIRLQNAIELSKERLDAAKKRERELNDLLLYFAGASGDASQYSYLVIQLGDLRSLIPQLEGDVRRAEDAWQRYKDRARQEGIPPGWLR